MEQQLIAASRSGQLPLLLELLQNQTALQLAVVSDWMGRTPLHRAARYNHVEVIKILLHDGVPVNVIDVHGQSPLHIAAFHGHLDALRALLMSDSIASACVRDYRNKCTPCDYLRLAMKQSRHSRIFHSSGATFQSYEASASC